MKSFETYLCELLGVEEKAKLLQALQQNKAIVISGPPQSGKTTLMRELRKQGYNAVEDYDVYEVKLTKPLEYRIRNFRPGIKTKRECPCCGAAEPEYFYLDEDTICLGCSECIYKTNEIY